MRGKLPQKDKYRVNRDITAPEVRVIDDQGEMLGVYKPYEALRIAEDKGLDLIEVAPNAKPPTCKIMDYGKWKYENKKKLVAAKKKQTVVSIKEIQLRPRTDDHDLNVKLKHARRFLLDGDKVKVNLRFWGREMAHQEIGVDLLKRVIGMLSDMSSVEVHPKKEGRQCFVLVAPDAAKIKIYKDTQAKLKAAEEKAAKELAEAQKAEGKSSDTKKTKSDAKKAASKKVKADIKAADDGASEAEVQKESELKKAEAKAAEE